VNLLDEATFIEVKQYKERLSLALKAAKICVFEVDLLHQKYTFFANAEDIFGVSGERILEDVAPYSKLEPEAYQQKVSEYFSHPDDLTVIDRAFRSILAGHPTTYEARMRAGGSDFVWCKLDVTPIIENGIPVKMIGVITDITALKHRTDRLVHAIHRDDFTHLYNKSYSVERIKDALSQHPDQCCALVLTDIDHFKRFNDQYGHSIGDRIILAVANTLRETFRETDIIGRFGGDEFILLVQNIPSREWLAGKLQALIDCREGDFCCTNSIGVSVFPQDARDFDSLFKMADQALYQSKLSNRTYTFFSADSSF